MASAFNESEGSANTEVRLVRWKANIGLGDEQAALERLAGDHAGEDSGWPHASERLFGEGDRIFRRPGERNGDAIRPAAAMR